MPCAASRDQRDRVNQHTDHAADKRAVDPHILQVTADFRFDLPAHFVGVPAFDDLGDQRRQQVPIAHDEFMREREPPGVELALNRRLAADALAERRQRSRQRLPHGRLLAG